MAPPSVLFDETLEHDRLFRWEWVVSVAEPYYPAISFGSAYTRWGARRAMAATRRRLERRALEAGPTATRSGEDRLAAPAAIRFDHNLGALVRDLYAEGA
jgi:hypothetical protein